MTEPARGAPPRPATFTTLSGLPVEERYGPPREIDASPHVGEPGEFPFTRGIHRNMYRGRLWTMRQFAGFGSAEDTNARFHYLLSQGQDGLSVAFDMPTLMGYDSDHERALGEVGREGVAIDSLADMEALFAGIPLDQVSTSMTINAPAAILYAMYVAVAERAGVPRASLRGTIQNDCLKEFIAQKEWIVPPRPSMKLVVDTLLFAARETPLWNPISISGYHIREAGATAVQELAFTLADGIAYLEAGVAAGLDIDEFAPRLSFFFDVHNDLFEEVAKLRAARRMWAVIVRQRFGAKNPRAWMLRTHAQTAGVSLTAQQPLNNVARTALQALAAVLGGTQSLHTNSLDETYALPTQEAVTVALRTQQIIAYESGVTSTVDPLGGSYFIEALTDEIERAAWRIIERVNAMGGMVNAIDAGYPMREIADASFHYQEQLERREKIIVGVNAFAGERPEPIPILRIDPEVERRQIERVRRVRAARDEVRVRQGLQAVECAARDGDNTMYPILDAVRAYATLGEICDVLRAVYGEYREEAVL